MRQEWDWPPTGRYRPPPRRWRYYRTIDLYQPTGWNSPGVKTAIRVYWRTVVTIIKVMISVPLAIVAIGAFWLLWIELGVIYSVLSHRLLG
jgi:hypothetical protein